MQITQCIASKQGLYNNTVLNLDNSVTVIYGANDSGKTLLALAMIDLIWGSFSSRSLLPYETWKKLNISVVVKIMDKSYRFTKNNKFIFSLAHADNNNQSEIFSYKNEKGKNFNPHQISKTLPEFNSWPLYNYLSELNADILDNTSFIHSPINIEAKNYLNKKILQKIILQDKSDFYKIYSLFQKKSDEQKTSGQFDNVLINKILSTENKIKETKKEIQLLELEESKNNKVRKEQYYNGKEIKKIKKEIAKLTEQKKIALAAKNNINSLLKLKKQVTDLKIEIENDKEIRFKIKNKLNNLKQIFPNFNNFAKLKKNILDIIQKSYSSVRDINDKINQFYINIEYNRKKLQKSVILLIIISITPFIVQNSTDKIPIPFNIQTFISSGIFILCLLLICIKLITFIFKNKKKSLTWLKKEKNERESNLYKILQENMIPFDRSIISEVYEFLLQYFEEYSSFQEQNDEVDEIRNTLKGEEYFKLKKEELKGSISHVKATTNNLKKEILKLDNKQYSNIEEFPIEDVMTRIDRNLEKKRNDLNDLKEVIDQIPIQNPIQEDGKLFPKNLRDTLRQTKSELDDLQDLKYAIDIIQQSLEDATIQREKNQLISFAKKISKNFNHLTDNNYLLKLNQEDYLELIKTGNCSKVSNPALSHLFNLALKISLTDFLIEANYVPPLIIDEPAIFMDKNRLANFINLIKEYSKKRQIIILTHDLYSYKNLGKHINL